MRCKTKKCQKKQYAKGLCKIHYNQKLRYAKASRLRLLISRYEHLKQKKHVSLSPSTKNFNQTPHNPGTVSAQWAHFVTPLTTTEFATYHRHKKKLNH